MGHARSSLTIVSFRRRICFILLFLLPIFVLRTISLLSFFPKKLSQPDSLSEPRLHQPTGESQTGSTANREEAIAYSNDNLCHESLPSTRAPKRFPPYLPNHKDLSIAFVGDSVTRYMYLSLVYYLRWGCWINDGHPFLELMVSQKMQLKTSTEASLTSMKADIPSGSAINISSWNEYLNYTNSLLYPNEQCDCYRNWDKTFNWNRHVENRYYSDTQLNNHVTFFTKFGASNLHGHWNATHVFDLQPYQNRVVSFSKTPYAWHYNTWDGFVSQYVSKLSPKPKYLVFNSGFWTGHMLGNVAVLEKLRTSLQDSDIVGIYRTTTFRNDEQSYEMYMDSKWRQHDKKVCQLFPCLNVSWTANLVNNDSNYDYYLDSIHFKSQIYNRMNIELLGLLSSL